MSGRSSNRGRGYAHFFGIDPVSLLSPGAQYIVDSGHCRVTYKDAEAIVKMHPEKRRRLSERVELDSGDPMIRCIEDVSRDVPTSTPAKNNGKLRESADDAAKKIDNLFNEPFNAWVEAFANPHGALKSDEYVEAVQCWDEAKKAWRRLRDTSRKFSNTDAKVR